MNTKMKTLSLIAIVSLAASNVFAGLSEPTWADRLTESEKTELMHRINNNIREEKKREQIINTYIDRLLSVFGLQQSKPKQMEPKKEQQKDAPRKKTGVYSLNDYR